jgi:uncharacterized protein (TIGR02145 family)
MKQHFYYLIMLLLNTIVSAQVGINNPTPHTSAALDITSTTRGFLPPRMTLAQRNAITAPAEGLLISCTDCTEKGLHQYINGAWQAIMSSNTGIYGTVVNPTTGKVWLDRNLGASQVATFSEDELAYGHLYQWGRNADGHQIPTSGSTTTLSGNYFTDNGLFIRNNTTPFNWMSPINIQSHMWSINGAENNPCPCGFRIPTAAEWEQERRTWSSQNASGAFNSPLKLPRAGYRYHVDGVRYSMDTHGYYWSSTTLGDNRRYLYFTSFEANMTVGSAANGMPVRCIKD